MTREKQYYVVAAAILMVFLLARELRQPRIETPVGARTSVSLHCIGDNYHSDDEALAAAFRQAINTGAIAINIDATTPNGCWTKHDPWKLLARYPTIKLVGGSLTRTCPPGSNTCGDDEQ